MSGDSSDLEALFDSIASGSAPVKPAPPPHSQQTEGVGDDDSDGLQALFDSVSDQSGASPTNITAEVDESAVLAMQGKVFQQVGVMTRQLHDTLTELGHGKLAQETVSLIPDAKDRLNYIANLTEQAACRVLNATDIVNPIIDGLESDAGTLGVKWDALFNNQMDVAEFKLLAEETRRFFKQGLPQKTRATKEQIMEIIMAQDFQDLTGQVIKKVISVAQELEAQLMGVLIETMPGERRTESVTTLLNGPVINTEGRTDIVGTQQQVDDLLDSLGF